MTADDGAAAARPGTGAEPADGHDRPAPGADLAALRDRLDRIDRQLLDTLRDRLACCLDIAHVKRRNEIPMMQPHRIGLVHRRAADYAAEHGVDGDFLRRLYDLVIDETYRLEDTAIGAAAPAVPATGAS
jgi:4-amino-4-deoxychorismate mutase